MGDVYGSAKDQYEDVVPVLERVLAEKPGAGVALCVYVSGERVLDVWGGASYGPRTMQLLFSATKGLTAIVFGRLMQAGAISLDAPVAAYWPSFAAQGKGELSVGDLLAHRGGLPGVDREFALAEWADGTVGAALAEQRPLWEPGSDHGYHPITYGVLAADLVRRVDGRSVGEILRDEIAGPLAVDAFIGLPDDRDVDVAPIVRQATEARPMATGTFAEAAYEHRPYSLDDNATWNDPAFHALELPAANGIASARALAKIYAACMGEAEHAERVLQARTIKALTTERSAGIDLVLGSYTRFGAGFQRPTPLCPMSSDAAFGHDGFGGCIAFADPALDLAFAYTTDRAPATGGLDPPSQALVAAVTSIARSRLQSASGR